MPRTLPASRTLLLGLCAFVALPLSVRGQAPEARDPVRRALGALDDSARVRLLAPGLVVDDGVFLGLTRDSVRLGYADARFSVGLDEIEGLEVQGTRLRSTALQSGAVGLVAGAAAGFFLAYFKCGDDVFDCDGHAARVALRWGAVFGTAGTGLGALAGSRLRRWRPVFP